MSEHEHDAYILGTDRKELHRLGLQHQVWAAEARRGWRSGGFTAGQSLLDLGCGPGFCTQELAYIAGATGRVTGIDKSAAFIDFAREVDRLHGLDIDYQAARFDDMTLPEGTLDGVYCRWALAWIPDPEAVIARLAAALKPGGRTVAHEYYDWETFSTEPVLPNLARCIAAALSSFRASEGDIDIGRRLPGLFRDAGLAVVEVRLMSKLARPVDLSWHWPGSFYDSYLPRLVAAGALDQATLDAALAEWAELAETPGACCRCPQMVEVIAEKPGRSSG